MTLLITCAKRSEVHQSSDYRISYQGRIVETANGTKQLTVTAKDWYARVAFTGIAFDERGYRTLDWISEEGLATSAMTELTEFVERLTRRGTQELQAVSPDFRRLTILVTAVQSARCRLFLVSNFESPRDNKRWTPLEGLRWFEIDLAKPVVLANGNTNAMPRWQVRRLEKFFRQCPDPARLRDHLEAVNREAARQPAFSHAISEGCWVSSLFADGTEQATNYGKVPGVADDVRLGFDVGAILRTLPELAGKQMVVHQTVAGHNLKSVPLPPPSGEAREIRFSSPTVSVEGIGQPVGSRYPRVTFEGREDTASLRKNETVTVVLAAVRLEVDPNGAGDVALEWQRLTAIPTVSGGQPRAWDYMYELHGGPPCHTLQVSQNSVALRTEHCPGLNVLGPQEELLLVAPVSGLLLHATPENNVAVANLVASFLIRDFPELAAR